MTNIINRKYGVLKVPQNLTELLAGIKAKEASKRALDKVGVSNNAIAVTDGRRLFTMDLPEGTIEDGYYFLTGEGFLLKDGDAGKFPKWRDLIPESNAVETIKLTCIFDSILGASKAIKAISEKGYLLKFEWISAMLKSLERLGVNEIEISFQKADPDFEKAIIITGILAQCKFTYMQMPIK